MARSAPKPKKKFSFVDSIPKQFTPNSDCYECGEGTGGGWTFKSDLGVFLCRRPECISTRKTA